MKTALSFWPWHRFAVCPQTTAPISHGEDGTRLVNEKLDGWFGRLPVIATNLVGRDWKSIPPRHGEEVDTLTNMNFGFGIPIEKPVPKNQPAKKLKPNT